MNLSKDNKAISFTIATRIYVKIKLTKEIKDINNENFKNSKK